ncbi:MAG: hypothetical protein HY563_09145 [Ignavibacteriales bacterium]|nr:hypothetical protein [Ignavibacteriales bacterium]
MERGRKIDSPSFTVNAAAGALRPLSALSLISVNLLVLILINLLVLVIS